MNTVVEDSRGCACNIGDQSFDLNLWDRSLPPSTDPTTALTMDSNNLPVQTSFRAHKGGLRK